MAASKRWTTTYTKHVTQKRKVYQDGILELSEKDNKVILYDECEKLIDSRFLKKDEILDSGQMLAFECHLVDIGCLEVRSNPIKDLNSFESSIDPNKLDMAKYREENGREHFHVLPQQINANGSTSKEWNALYTTQITQKAKRYHDGVVQISSCGPQMNKIILLNENGEVLASKYQKSVESIMTGSICELPNYLIEICEPRNSVQGSKDDLTGRHPNPSTSRSKPTDKMEVIAKRSLPNCLLNNHLRQVPGRGRNDARNQMNSGILMNNKSSCNEWNVLYTTHITKKAKTYHDGILRLSIGHVNQVTLLHENGMALAKKYLKSAESVVSGSRLELPPNYLVEIGEPQIFEEGHESFDKGCSKQIPLSIKNNSIKLASCPKSPGKNHSKQIPCTANNNSIKLASSEKLVNDKPLRNACQILSILDKTMSELSDVKNMPLEQIHYSDTPYVCISDSRSKILESDGNIEKPEELDAGACFCGNPTTEAGVPQENSLSVSAVNDTICVLTDDCSSSVTSGNG